jgi:hypothetical protein
MLTTRRCGECCKQGTARADDRAPVLVTAINESRDKGVRAAARSADFCRRKIFARKNFELFQIFLSASSLRSASVMFDH